MISTYLHRKVYKTSHSLLQAIQELRYYFLRLARPLGIIVGHWPERDWSKVARYANELINLESIFGTVDQHLPAWYTGDPGSPRLPALNTGFCGLSGSTRSRHILSSVGAVIVP